jgi:RTX calcium-binding nonapeptide repeat (4 copies)
VPGRARRFARHCAVRDELTSEIGSPRLLGGPGDDHLQIGLSTPTAYAGKGTDSVGLWFNGQDRIYGGGGRDRAAGGGGHDICVAEVRVSC